VNGPIAQAVALTIFGNQILRGGELDDFWPSLTVFNFCKAVSFLDMSGTRPRLHVALAPTPAAWSIALPSSQKA
jgi:hypothetical protein